MPPRWNATIIKDDLGKEQKAVSPIIISASRSTDIPAFYSDWFFDRLARGYCLWTNPFNGVPLYISFAQSRFFVFWSKNPQPMLSRLNELTDRGLGYYFQFTLNDYDAEKYEPFVPSLQKRITTFKRLSGQLGRHRVIWRFDPLILTNLVSVESLLERIESLMDELHEYTEKCVFSFADIATYKSVQRNLAKNKVDAREFTEDEMRRVATQIGLLAKKYGLHAATCAEKLELKDLNVEHNKCIDDDLIMRCCPDDVELRKFLGRAEVQQADMFGVTSQKATDKHKLKDAGQRDACGCIVSKDIGSYNTCPHMCVYCYANTSHESVQRNLKEHMKNSHSPSIKI